MRTQQCRAAPCFLWNVAVTPILSPTLTGGPSGGCFTPSHGTTWSSEWRRCIGLLLAVVLWLNQEMRVVQRLLFADPRPLVERLGESFLRSVPACPGVYLMRDAGGTVLYVGKAKNLRKRLSSYRVANPERVARRHLRLLRMVEHIGWEECVDETAALRREAELLLSLKPRFNRAGVWIGRRRYLLWREADGGLVLAVREVMDPEFGVAGPFGVLGLVLHRLLVRRTWCRLHSGAGVQGMPCGWCDGGHGMEVLIPSEDAVLVREACVRLGELWQPGMKSFQAWARCASSSFERQLEDDDLERIEDAVRSVERRRSRAESGSIEAGSQEAGDLEDVVRLEQVVR